MLLHETDNGMVCIGQAAHSWVSGQLARRWGNGSFRAPEPLAEVCLAAEQHDIGMVEWDRFPDPHPQTGWPLSFLELPVATHIALWTDAPGRVLSQSPHAALLISMHGHALFSKRRPAPEIAAYLRAQEALQQDLLAAIGEPPARARRNQQLVWTVDFLALAGLLPRWTPATQAAPDGEIRIETAGPQTVTVDPWPFDLAELCIAYPGRLLTEPSASAAELRARLARAPWVSVEVTWRPRARRHHIGSRGPKDQREMGGSA